MNFSIRKHIKNLIFVSIFLVAILVIYSTKNDFDSMLNIIKNMQLSFVFLAILILILSYVFESLILYLLINKVNHTKHKYPFSHAILLNFSGQFFNGITPFSSGGQPFQIYYLSKKKRLSISRVTLTLLASFILFQLTIFLYSILSISTRYNFFKAHIPNVFYIILIALIVNLIVPTFVFLLSEIPPFKRFIVDKVLVGISSFFLFKRLNKHIPKIEKHIDDFRKEIRMFLKNKVLILISLLVSLLRLAMFFSIPAILFLALGYYETVETYWYEMLVGAALVNMVSSIIPLPGGTGGAEIMFITVFSSVFGFDDVVVASVSIVWRVITYYLALIIGMLSFYIITRKRFCKPLSNDNVFEEIEFSESSDVTSIL